MDFDNITNFTNIISNNTNEYEIVFENFIFPIGMMFGFISCFICCCAQVNPKWIGLKQESYTIMTKTINSNELENKKDNPPKYEDNKLLDISTQNTNSQQYMYNTFVMIKNDTP
jgi:hypothetical protein